MDTIVWIDITSTPGTSLNLPWNCINFSTKLLKTMGLRHYMYVCKFENIITQDII